MDAGASRAKKASVFAGRVKDVVRRESLDQPWLGNGHFPDFELAGDVHCMTRSSTKSDLVPRDGRPSRP